MEVIRKKLNSAEIRYKSVFEESPISILEEDFSAVSQYLNTLKEDGVTDFREYLTNNPDQVDKCSELVKIVNVNKTTIEMYHASSKEALLTNLKTIFTENSNRTFIEQLIKVANGESSYEGECVNKTFDGEFLDVYLQWSLTKGCEKDYSIVFVSLINITSLKNVERALEESEQKFRTITNSANDAIVMVDNTGKINFWNSAATRIFGRTPAEVMGKQMHKLLAPERYQTAFKRGFSKLKQTGKGNVIGKTLEMYVYRNDGTEFPVELSIAAIKIGGQWNGLSIIRDITERKENEEENRRQREQIKLINKILRHDLANSLAAINSSVNIYKRNDDKQMLENVINNVTKSSDLIMKMRKHELLIASNNLSIYDIGIHFKKILLNYPEVKFSIEGKSKIFADDSLNSVIDNLIRNAVVHSGTDRIDIKISSSRSTCEVRVIDYGKGIPENLHHKIFEEGFKHGVTGHSGLGLHIVKKSIKNWGGEIFVEDNVPKGAIFVIYLRNVN